MMSVTSSQRNIAGWKRWLDATNPSQFVLRPQSESIDLTDVSVTRANVMLSELVDHQHNRLSPPPPLIPSQKHVDPAKSVTENITRRMSTDTRNRGSRSDVTNGKHLPSASFDVARTRAMYK